jgi:IS30 family transposase
MLVRGRPLSAEEREDTSRGLAANLGVAEIAASLGRNRSVIDRELARNGGREKYRAGQAQECAEALARRPK